MNLTVWKFPLTAPNVVLEMPKGAEILHIADQRGTPHMWARCDPEAPIELRRFIVTGTGQPCPSSKHIGTFLLDGGDLVFHVFEEPA